jgi:hypothetical protein
MKVTAQSLLEEMAKRQQERLNKLVEVYTLQIEAVVRKSARNNLRFAKLNTCVGCSIPQILMDKIRENGFKIERKLCEVFNNEYAYTITW